VFRWERRWGMEGKPFIDPVEYPPTSVATSGTHDTESMASWWAQAAADERRKVCEVPTIQRLTGPNDDTPFNPTVRDALLEALFASGSNLLLLPIQDVLGTRERINEPATVNDRNWTYRLPWPCDRLEEVPEARERQAALHKWAAAYGRL